MIYMPYLMIKEKTKTQKYINVTCSQSHKLPQQINANYLLVLLLNNMSIILIYIGQPNTKFLYHSNLSDATVSELKRIKAMNRHRLTILYVNKLHNR